MDERNYQIQKAFAYAEIPLEDKQTEKYQREKLLIAAGEKEKSDGKFPSLCWRLLPDSNRRHPD